MNAKRTVAIALVALFALGAQGWGQSIVGSEHDFSNTSWANGEICLPCHAPHNVPAGVNVLWNHETTTATFTMYSNLVSGNPVASQPGFLSKMCLSCHDGTTAVDSYGGQTGNQFITGDELIGTDLSNDHPIGVEYPVGDPGYNPTTNFGQPGEPKLVPITLLNGNDGVECVSCHNPHDDSNGKFLRVTDAASALCLKCHNK